MGRIWTLENRYRKFLEIEIAVCYALAEKGLSLWKPRSHRAKGEFFCREDFRN